jgi:hypothetical protein
VFETLYLGYTNGLASRIPGANALAHALTEDERRRLDLQQGSHSPSLPSPAVRSHGHGGSRFVGKHHRKSFPTLSVRCAAL